MLIISGMGVMEVSIINFFSFGDWVLVGNNGKFGDCWVKVVKIFGLVVEEIKVEWGKVLDFNDFKILLEVDSDKIIKVLIIIYFEIFIGVLNDLVVINVVVKVYGGVLMIVDVVISLGVIFVAIDDLGLDVVVFGF